MSEAQEQGGGAEADFDLTQFYQIFFEEAGENLDQMEQMLLVLNLQTADDEDLNGIFRCAHSVKGGAATFGFADVAELTHQMESLLDRLRRHEIEPSPAMVDVLLAAADVSRSLLARHQAGGIGEVPPTADLVARIGSLANGGDVAAERSTGTDAAQTVLAGSSARAIMIDGDSAMALIWAKSFCGSKGKRGYKPAAMTNELSVNNRVWPSGADLATASAPMVPPAPPLFSTTTC